YWSAERLPLDQVPEVYPGVAADLCVAVLSPSDTHRSVMEKVREYLNRGVRLIWMVDPGARAVTVYRSREQIRILEATGTLAGEDVLPGFRCAVAELFA